LILFDFYEKNLLEKNADIPKSDDFVGIYSLKKKVTALFRENGQEVGKYYRTVSAQLLTQEKG